MRDTELKNILMQYINMG